MEENDTSHRSPASQQVVEAEETGETEVPVQPEQVHHRQPRISRHDRHQPRVVSYRFTINASNVGSDEVVRNDVWSCLVVLLTFWFFASAILILGFYGSFNLQLGPNCSYLIQASPIFVHAIKVQQLSDHIEGPMLYGFHKSPPLDVETTWSQNHTASVEPNFHTEWAYYLNAGSQINISYDVKFPRSNSLYIVIAQGREALLEWIDFPNANSTLSWKIIYGKGNTSKDMKQPGRYFVAVGNLNSETVGVDLNIITRSVNYNTSNPYFKCSLSNHACSFKLRLIKPNAAVLTSPPTRQRREALTPEQINEACYVDVNANKAVFESLKNNPKVNYDGRCFSYKAKHELKNKDQLLVLIRRFPEGMAVIDLKDAYPNVMEDLQTLKTERKVWLLANFDSQEDIVYPNDPRVPIKVDDEIKQLFRSIELPRDMLDIEKDLQKNGMKPATNTAKRRAAAQIQGISSKPKPKKKKHEISKRTKLTNAHLPELFQNLSSQ